MTIKVSITRDDPANGNNVQVAIVNRDIYGNDSVDPGHVFQIEPGETKSFWLHRTQSLRVYETSMTLPGR